MHACAFWIMHTLLTLTLLCMYRIVSPFCFAWLFYLRFQCILIHFILFLAQGEYNTCYIQIWEKHLQLNRDEYKRF